MRDVETVGGYGLLRCVQARITYLLPLAEAL